MLFNLFKQNTPYLHEIAIVKNELHENFPALASYYDKVFIMLKEDIKKRKEEYDSTVRELGVERLTLPYAIVLSRMTDELMYDDEMFLCPGMLSTTGKEMYKLWIYLMEKLVRLRYFTKEQYETNKKDLIEYIHTSIH